MIEYKTLYRLRTRLFWGSMLENINKWTSWFSHCDYYNMWHKQKSELYLYWSVTFPLLIMHVTPPQSPNKKDVINTHCIVNNISEYHTIHNTTHRSQHIPNISIKNCIIHLHLISQIIYFVLNLPYLSHIRNIIY